MRTPSSKVCCFGLVLGALGLCDPFFTPVAWSQAALGSGSFQVAADIGTGAGRSGAGSENYDPHLGVGSRTSRYDAAYARSQNGRLPGERSLPVWPSLIDQLPQVFVRYHVIEQSLDRVLVELGALGGVTIQPSRQLKTPIKSMRLEGPFNEVLDRLMQHYRLVGMREGTKLTLASDSETMVRYVKATPQSTPERIMAVLRLAGVSNVDGRVVLDSATGLIQITMPGIIGERIETILVNASAPSGTEASAPVDPTMIKFGKILK